MTATATAGRQITIELWQDPDVDSPCKDDGWKLYSFSRRHSNFKDPNEFLNANGSGEGRNVGIRRKLETGTAFVLSYFEHGESMWMMKNSPEWDNCPDKRWDGVRTAGILIWEQPVRNLGPKTKEARYKDAHGFVETYTAWANGETYGYTITDESGEEIEGPCGGCIGTDHLLSAVREHTKPDDEITITGEMKWLSEHHDFHPQPKEVPIGTV